MKRKRPEEEHQPASVLMTAHAEPLTVLAVVMWLRGTLVWLQLCNSQCVAMFSFVCLPQRVPRPFAGTPVYSMSLTHAERLCAVGCGLKGRLVRLVSLGVDRHFEPPCITVACYKLMQSTARRVASKLMALVRDKAAKEAEELCASGRCAAALVPLQQALRLGDLSSFALNAWLLIDGREGVAKDRKRALVLVKEGARLGCHHCQGVLAYCTYRHWCPGPGALTINSDESHDDARSLELAQESAGRGSRYGQYALGVWHEGCPGLGRSGNLPQSLAFLRLAAAQGLDRAQIKLGEMCFYGHQSLQLGLFHPLEYAEALLWYTCAAAQGHPEGLKGVAECYQEGCGVRKSKKEAIRWFKLAKAAGYPHADHFIRSLNLRDLLRELA